MIFHFSLKWVTVKICLAVENVGMSMSHVKWIDPRDLTLDFLC